MVYELDSLLFQTKHGSMWVHTLLLKTVECGVLKTHHICCIKTLCSRQRLVFGGHCLKNELRDHCFLKWQLLQKIIQIFWRSSLPCRIQQDGVTAHSVTTAVGFFSITSSVIILSGMDFGYQNSQTLCHLTFSVGIYERKSLEQELKNPGGPLT